MKNRLKCFLSFTSLAIVAVCITVSCNKKFDEPPVYTAPDIIPDLTISDLKAMHVSGKFEQITTDKTIGGIVVADDRTGEFYKTIVIEDETGGISVKLDAYDLYTKYPVGRKVYIKVKDLYLGDYNKLIEIGGGVDNTGSSPRLDEIPSVLIDKYVIKGTLDNAVTPKVVTVDELDDSYQNMLIQLDNYEFAVADTSKTYAKQDLSSSAVNFTLQSCSDKSIILRNSSYADFAGYKVPGGNGSIIAIYTVFGTTKQLNIRDTSDVKFYGARCGSGGTGAVVDIATIKSFYNGSDVTLGSYKIGGVVISDAVAKNISSGNIVLQDKDAGIKLYFGSSAATANFSIGDSLVVDVTGGTLQDYNGSKEISLSSSALPSVAIATGKTITPKALTIAEIATQLPDIEYTLVTIKDATATSGIYSGNKTLTDASGSMTLYTSSTATFAGDALPTTAKTFTGYCTLFGSTKEMMLRNTNDVTDGEAPPPTGDTLIISEYVEGSSNNKYLEIYNSGSGAADLSKYTVKMYTNGAITASSTAVLDAVTGLGTLPAGAAIILKNSGAALTLPAAVTAYNSGVCGFNGDDAVTLEKDGVVVDVFGLVGIDPGDSWTINSDAAATKDKTVRRQAGITHGNTDWASSAATEWDVISTTDDVSNLGTR
ncbi:DUF5689 domain-containing protein [Panacibacter ginsenosidivorans]|nr:DUF5689 domain-containing protein [Panacibacter ginsenosidivorans]